MNSNFLQDKYFNMKIRANHNNKTIEEVLSLFKVAKSKVSYFKNNNLVYLNGEQTDVENRVKTGDYLMIDISKFEKIDYDSVDKDIDIIYEDDYLLAISKPPGYVMYDKDKTSIANFIANYYMKNSFDHTIRHCHRLDSETSGCLIFAKDVITHSIVSNMFENGLISKEYLAIVEGITNVKGIITSSIGKDRHVNGKMVISKTGLSAKTIYERIDSSKKYSLLRVKIETGRTHQIRVHMSSILHPLFGDKLYGAVDNSRVMLHCSKISFVHPIIGKKLELVAKLPQDFKNALKVASLSCK